MKWPSAGSDPAGSELVSRFAGRSLWCVFRSLPTNTPEVRCVSPSTPRWPSTDNPDNWPDSEGITPFKTKGSLAGLDTGWRLSAPLHVSVFVVRRLTTNRDFDGHFGNGLPAMNPAAIFGVNGNHPKLAACPSTPQRASTE